MSFTPQQIIDDARPTINDSAKARHTDADGLRYIKGGIRALALLRPDLFVQRGLLETVALQVDQDISTEKPDALKLRAIFATEAGVPIAECDLSSLDEFTPTWRTATAVNSPYNWARFPQDDPVNGSGTRYYLSPAPKADVNVMGEWVEATAPATLSTAIELPDAYFEPLRHYYIFCAESMDDEHVVTQRAAQSMNVFMQGIGLAKVGKSIQNEGRNQ